MFSEHPAHFFIEATDEWAPAETVCPVCHGYDVLGGRATIDTGEADYGCGAGDETGIIQPNEAQVA